jgi:hypothetical protein
MMDGMGLLASPICRGLKKQNLKNDGWKAVEARSKSDLLYQSWDKYGLYLKYANTKYIANIT